MRESTFDKYKLVIDEWFVNGFNGIKAYQKFYPSVDSSSADGSFRKILDNTRVKDYLKSLYDKANNDSAVAIEDIRKELESFVMMDVTEIVRVGQVDIPITTENEEGEKEIRFEKLTRVVIKDFDELTDVQRRFIKSVKETKDGIAIEFFSKEKAFEMLNKHKGFYGEHNYQKNPSLSPEQRERRIAELKEKLKG